MHPKCLPWSTAALAAFVAVAAWSPSALAVDKPATASSADTSLCLMPKDKPFPVDIEEAKTHMAAGVSFMQDPEGARYEEAYPEFRTAYSLSGSLNALQNLAICAEKLELDGEAVACFHRFLDKKGKDIAPEDKAQVESDLRALEAAVSIITITTDEPNVKVDDTRTPRRGTPIRNVYAITNKTLKLGVHPGEHKFVASVEGKPAIEWNAVINNGDKAEHAFMFEKKAPPPTVIKPPEPNVKPPEPNAKPPEPNVKPPEPVTKPEESELPPRGPVPLYGWAMVGVTGALAVGWGVTAGVSSAKSSQYKKDNVCDSSGCPAASVDLALERSQVKTASAVADVLLGLTVASAATTVVLIVTRPRLAASPGKKEARGPRFGQDWVMAPFASPGADGNRAGGLVLNAAF